MRPPGSVRCPRAGFNLIGLSILLTVGALVMVSVLPGEDAGDYNRKSIDTYNKMAKIDKAMNGFASGNGRLPCPADGQYAVTSSSFGKESATAGTCTGGAPASPLGPDATTYIVGGTVPTRTLSLPDDYAYDAWGRRITYIVDKRATDSTTCKTLQSGGTGGGIAIKDSSGAQVKTTMATFISHGPDGHGAWPPQSSTAANRINAAATDTDTLNNASVNGAFATSFDNVFIRKEKTASFDDVVYLPNPNKCCVGTAALCTGANPNGFRIDGANGGDWAMAAASAVVMADLNGDGMKDMIIAQGDYVDAYNKNGGIYVIYGKAGAPGSGAYANPIDLTLPLYTPAAPLDGTNGFAINVDGDAFTNDVDPVDSFKDNYVGLGLWAIKVADVDHDGHPDIIAQAFNSPWDTHGVLVIFNPFPASWPAETLVNPALADGTSAAFIELDPAGDWTGWSMVTPGGEGSIAAGDINADLYADIIIGDGSYNGNAGRAYVVFGKARPWAATMVADQATLNGTAGFGGTGTGFVLEQDKNTTDVQGALYHMSSCDVNNDGFDDIISSAYNGGVVIFGKAAWAAYSTMDQTWYDGTNGTQFVSLSGYDSPTACGDVNNDGIKDVVFGAPYADASDKGGAYVVFGVPDASNPWNSGSIDMTGAWTNGTNAARLIGDTNNYGMGITVAVGDFNGDGIKDVVLGSGRAGPAANYGPTKAGAVEVVFGKNAGTWSASTTLNSGFLNGTTGVRFNGQTAQDHLGGADVDSNWGGLISLGDINNDGSDDILVSASMANYNSGNAGASLPSMSGSAYLIYGTTSTLISPVNVSVLTP